MTSIRFLFFLVLSFCVACSGMDPFGGQAAISTDVTQFIGTIDDDEWRFVYGSFEAGLDIQGDSAVLQVINHDDVMGVGVPGLWIYDSTVPSWSEYVSASWLDPNKTFVATIDLSSLSERENMQFSFSDYGSLDYGLFHKSEDFLQLPLEAQSTHVLDSDSDLFYEMPPFEACHAGTWESEGYQNGKVSCDFGDYDLNELPQLLTGSLWISVYYDVLVEAYSELWGDYHAIVIPYQSETFFGSSYQYYPVGEISVANAQGEMENMMFSASYVFTVIDKVNLELTVNLKGVSPTQSCSGTDHMRLVLAEECYDLTEY